MADKIQKSIEFKAAKAVGEIDKLLSRLQRTSDMLKRVEKTANGISFQKFVPAIDAFVKSFSRLDALPKNIENIRVMAQALNRFRMTAVELNKTDMTVSFAKITRAIYSFTDSIRRMEVLATTINQIAELGRAINRLVNASIKLQNMKVSFTSITQAIYAFVGSILRIKDLDEVIVKLERLATAMDTLVKSSKKFTVVRDFAEFEKAKKKVSGLQETIAKLKEELKKLKSETKITLNIADKIPNVIKGIQNGIKLINFTHVYYWMKRIGDLVYDLVKVYSEYQENINLATVAFGKLNDELRATTELYPFVAEMTEAFGLNESELIRSVGLFKQMANAMKLTHEQGDLLAKGLTKMAYDISSLYNISFERAMSALQSSLVGQTKPIRGATGADITENTLRITLQELNIGKEIRELSYVEKRLIMVISLTKQLTNAQGDLAKTIEAPANQLKVLQQQLGRLAKAIGNVLTIGMQHLLPFINGFVMALVEAIEFIAKFMRVLFDIPEASEDIDYSGIDEGVSDIIDGMEEAEEQAKELEKSLLGIDELNVLQPTETTTAFDGIDPTILEAFTNAMTNWDNMMDSVNMKAHAIRDAILSWLGLEKDEKGNWLLDMDSTLGKIITKITEAKGLMEGFLNLGNVEEGEEGEGVGGLLNSIKEIWQYVDGIAATLLEIKFPFLSGFLKIVEGIREIKESGVTLESVLDILEGIGLVLIGIGATLGLKPFLGLGLAIKGISDTIDAINKMMEDGEIELHEIVDVLLGLGETIVGLMLLTKLKTLVAWIIVAKNWIVDVGKAIVLAIGGNSAAASALTFLLGKLKTIFAWVSIIVGAFEIFKNIQGWIDGTIPPLQALFGILKGIALVVIGIMALIGNWAGVAAATAALVAAGIAESAVKKSSQKNNKETTDNEKAKLEVELETEISSIDKTINSTLQKINVQSYANGGYPSKGLFMMNEGNSAEMLGTINGRTAVVNNDQIAGALANALAPLLGTVVTAVENVAASDRPIVLYADSREIARASQKGSRKLGYNPIGGEFANV